MVVRVLKEYKTIREIAGPLMLVQLVEGVKYGELVEIAGTGGETRRGRVLEVSDNNALVQLFEGSSGMDLSSATVSSLATA